MKKQTLKPSLQKPYSPPKSQRKPVTLDPRNPTTQKALKRFTPEMPKTAQKPSKPKPALNPKPFLAHSFLQAEAKRIRSESTRADLWDDPSTAPGLLVHELCFRICGLGFRV